LIKATVSIGGGSSHSDSQSSSLSNDGSTLHAGGNVNLIATGSGKKDASGFATDGDINARGTQISGQNVTLNAARDINLQSAQDTNQLASHNSSSGGSVGVGLGIGGQQNGFTLELAANASKGHANGQGVTNRDTQITAGDTLSMTSGRDTNLRGAEVSGDAVNASIGRDLNIASQQDTATYDSKQSSAGFRASICVPPFCYGQTVSGSASASQQNINANYQSVNQQSGIYAGTGGYDVNVGNHTQLDGGVIASTATPDKNSLSTQTLGFTNLENHASYSGDTVGFSASGGFGWSGPGGAMLKTPVTSIANSCWAAELARFGTERILGGGHEQRRVGDDVCGGESGRDHGAGRRGYRARQHRRFEPRHGECEWCGTEHVQCAERAERHCGSAVGRTGRHAGGR
jgi:filamentous hemagglutinin